MAITKFTLVACCSFTNQMPLFFPSPCNHQYWWGITFLSLELMADVILYPSTTTQCSISFHPSIPPNCSRSRYSSERVNKLLGDTQKPLWLSLLFIQYGPGFYLSIFILCWKIVADNLGNKHGRIKLHDVLVPLSTLPILLSSHSASSAPHFCLPIQSSPFIRWRW